MTDSHNDLKNKKEALHCIIPCWSQRCESNN
nr:MAG TPA: hypothetical protein [Caudoviricetes sp.]